MFKHMKSKKALTLSKSNNLVKKYMDLNTDLEKKRVIMFPINTSELVPPPRTGRVNKNSIPSSQLRTTLISFNGFTNKLKNTDDLEVTLSSKLMSKGICYLFVINDNLPCAFINDKLIELPALTMSKNYSLADVVLNVIQQIKEMNKKKGEISTKINYVVLYNSMIKIKLSNKLNSPHYYMSPVVNHNYNTATRTNSVNVNKSHSSRNHNSAYSTGVYESAQRVSSTYSDFYSSIPNKNKAGKSKRRSRTTTL